MHVELATISTISPISGRPRLVVRPRSEYRMSEQGPRFSGKYTLTHTHTHTHTHAHTHTCAHTHIFIAIDHIFILGDLFIHLPERGKFFFSFCIFMTVKKHKAQCFIKFIRNTVTHINMLTFIQSF